MLKYHPPPVINDVDTRKIQTLNHPIRCNQTQIVQYLFRSRVLLIPDKIAYQYSAHVRERVGCKQLRQMLSKISRLSETVSSYSMRSHALCVMQVTVSCNNCR